MERVGQVHVDAVVGDPLREEVVLHGVAGGEEAGLGDAELLGLGGEHVGQVQHRYVDGGRHLVVDLVEGGGAHQDQVGATGDHALRGGDQDLGDLVPGLLVLERRQLGQVDGGQHDLGGVETAEPLLDTLVESLVVRGCAFPAHAADESDRLHCSSVTPSAAAY